VGKRSREIKERWLRPEGRGEAFIKKYSNLEKIYFWIIEWGTYLSLFTPLILMKSYFFPYVVPKTVFFRIVVDIVFIAYILLVVSNRKYLPKFNALAVAVAIFIGITVLTSFTGINLGKSFWSTFERMTGLITFLHLFVFFIILISVFRERKYWEKILTVSIIVGVIESFYTLFSSNPSSHGGGTVGNVSFLAAYLLFDIFFAIIMLFVKKGGWRIFYGLALIVTLLPMFFSIELPRGGLGAFFIGIVLLGLGYMIFSGKKLLRILAPIVLVLVVLMGIGASQTHFFKKEFSTNIIKEIPGDARLLTWQIGFKSWQEKFLLGWGQENFNIAYNEHFSPKLPQTGDVWYDRVHNVVLDTAVTSGILGLLSYLSIFGIAIFGLLKICPKVNEKRNLFLPLGMVALLMAYFIQDIFVFDMISTYTMFFLSLAFVYFLIQGENPQSLLEKEESKRGAYYLIGILLIIITIFTLYFGNIQSARASRYTVLGVVSPLEKAIPLFRKALDVSPMSIFETPEQFARKMDDLTFNEGQDKEVLKNGFGLSVEELKKSIAKNPQDYRLYLFLGRHYNNFYYLTHDQEKLGLAEEFLKKAVELSPDNQQTYWSLAQTELSQGKDDEAINSMQKAVDLEPSYAKSHWYLAMTYRAVGRYKLALEKIKDAEKLGYNWKVNVEDLKKVIDVYQNLRDDEDLVLLYPLAIELDPQNAQFRAGLEVAYANVGQFDKARQLAKEAIALNPDFASQFEEFLKRLPQ